MQPLISGNNAYQSTIGGNQIAERAFGNLPMGDAVTIEEVNETISSGQKISCSEGDEPAFGSHLREAAETVKKLFAR